LGVEKERREEERKREREKEREREREKRGELHRGYVVKVHSSTKRRLIDSPKEMHFVR
jgi:exosome complex RNA-binding protein Rrp4